MECWLAGACRLLAGFFPRKEPQSLELEAVTGELGTELWPGLRRMSSHGRAGAGAFSSLQLRGGQAGWCGLSVSAAQ